MELRSVIAELVMHFDIKFAHGGDGSTLLNQSKDFFIVSLAELRLILLTGRLKGCNEGIGNAELGQSDLMIE
jgi:hypothetical protein